MALFEHDLFGKPVPTFPDHALAGDPPDIVAIGAAREVIQSQINEERGAALLDAAIAALPQRLR